jgi:subtilisin family serine protease
VLDSRLRFLVDQVEEAETLAALETTGRFGLSVEGVDRPRVRVLTRVDDVTDEELRERGLVVTTRAGNIVSGEIALADVEQLDALDAVILIEAARPMVPELDASLPETRANVVHTGPPGLRGAGVIVGSIDSGIDWRHQCFRDGAGNTRVLRLWDQILVPQAGEAGPAPFNYGVEYQQGQINTALAVANPLNVVRSIDETGGHGTHVIGIAAGDGSAAGNGQPAFTFVGVAPEADIVLVANRVTTEAFGDSATTLDAVQYIFNVAQTLGRPAVINLSQGDNLGPHDGTSLLERGIDNLLGGPGRSMVKSAGNAASAGVHASGTVTAGGTDTVQFLVPANDDTPDTLDFWYDGADRLGFRITPPGGTASAIVNPGTTTTLTLSNNNRVFVDSVVNHPNNGDNRIYVQIQVGSAPFVQQGTWTVTLTGTTVTSGGWHGWIERGTTVPQFVGAHRNDQVTISVPGTSSEVITAASYITKGAGVGNLSTFSSRGPTRDGRAAPTIGSPGQQVLSANSGAGTGTTQYIGMSGTSMAAPHVAGTVALMFQAAPELTQQQIINRLTSNARSDAFTGGVPNRDWGAGKLDAQAAVNSIIDDETSWITALYADLLGRAPDQPGLAFWVARRLRGASLRDMVTGFLNSTEYCTNLVTSLYADLLGRQPDPAGLQQWVGQLERSTPRHEIQIGFLDSVEYKNNNMPPDDFVESLYHNLLRRGSEAEGKKYWIDVLVGGASTADVARGFLFSEEYCTQQVTELYAALLGRAPDPTGLAYWMGRMSNGTAFQETQYGFLTSDEYRTRSFTRF